MLQVTDGNYRRYTLAGSPVPVTPNASTRLDFSAAFTFGWQQRRTVHRRRRVPKFAIAITGGGVTGPARQPQRAALHQSRPSLS